MTIDRGTVIRFAEKSGIAYKTHRPATFRLGVLTPETLKCFAELVLEHERKPLKVWQVNDLLWNSCQVVCNSDSEWFRLVRATESAHGITNKESSDASK